MMFPSIGLLMGVMLLAMGGARTWRSLAPGRNLAGDPAYETLLERCTIPGTRASIRLYRGGAGATTAYWYTLTRERPGAPERQIWYSYEAPEVTSIACDRGVVTLVGEGGTVATLTAAEIEHDLVRHPLAYRYGGTRPERLSWDSVQTGALTHYARTDRTFGIFALVLGAALAIFSTFALVRVRRS